jgi:hypothetical protein
MPLNQGVQNSPLAIRYLPSDVAVVVVLQGPSLSEALAIGIEKEFPPSKLNCLLGDESLCLAGRELASAYLWFA